ncbi:MAG TPA: hypothetical protein VL463_05540 [Kofleriaceae bacterium]|jgi:hypothetical protein|nr:hypothetical protein [Kofleriaceae bacterium]
MHIVSVVSRGQRGLLVVSVIAAIAAIAWRVTHRPAPAPPPPELITCEIPDVMLQPRQFATPPPGDPYPRPPVTARGEPAIPGQLVEAVLIDRPSVVAGCGTMIFETTMVFHPLESTGAGDLRVLVPCAEMTRPMYSDDAGNAGILHLRHRYMLSLIEALDAADGKNDRLWRAVRIDER